MKCLLIKNDGIGDLFLTTGIIKTLGEKFSQIDLVTCIDNRELVNHIGGLSKTYFISRDGLRISSSKEKQFHIPKFDVDILDELKNVEYDVAIVLRRFIRSSTFVLMSHVNAKVKHACWQYPTNIDHKTATDYTVGWNHYSGDHALMHETLYYQSFLNLILKIRNIDKPVLTYLKKNDKKLSKSIGLNLDGRGWHLYEKKESWFSLVDDLVKSGWEILLFGKSGRAIIIAAEIESNYPEVTNLVDRISFDSLLGYFNSLKYYIGNDTGLTHIASLYVDKVLVIHDGSGLSRFFPWPDQSNQYIIYHSLDCFDCIGMCTKRELECINKISYRNVSEYFEKIVNDENTLKNLNLNNRSDSISIDMHALSPQTKDLYASLQDCIDATAMGIPVKFLSKQSFIDSHPDISNSNVSINFKSTELEDFYFSIYKFFVYKKWSLSIRHFLLRKVSSVLTDVRFIKKPFDRELKFLISELDKEHVSYTFETDKVDIDDYCKYFEKIDYINSYPSYSNQYKRSLSRKIMEHYLSFKLLNLKVDDVFIDVAASSSPVKLILNNFYGMREVYKQDLNMSDSVRSKYKISSNANDIPVSDNFFDAMTLHNSWEHFESTDDLDFIKEAGRILKPGGSFLILPLDLANDTDILTSPLIWRTKYKNLSSIPLFDKNAKVFINEQKLQRQEKRYAPKYILQILNEFSDIFNFKIIHFENIVDGNNELSLEKYEKCTIGAMDHFPEFVLLGTKK